MGSKSCIVKVQYKTVKMYSDYEENPQSGKSNFICFFFLLSLLSNKQFTIYAEYFKSIRNVIIIICYR